jgi:ketosteroid isomerase-like protein
MADNVELVRELWDAFERGGIEAVLAIADPDVEWEPYGGGGTVYRGHDGLRAYMQSRAERKEQADARLYSAFGKGDFVVGRGEIRIKGEDGVVTMQPGWLYEFRGGRLVRFRGFPSQEAALRAAGLMPDDAVSVVRDLWAAFNRRDVARMLALITDDCEWHRYEAPGHAITGRDALRAFYERAMSGLASAQATEYSFNEMRANAVAVSGSMQSVDARGGLSQRQIHCAYWLREGKVRRAQSFATREQAVAAAQREVVESPGT